MKARVENQRGYYPQWAGLALLPRDEFIAWAIRNPPPREMWQPSVDRIDPSRGYTLDNIRWLEARQNSRGKFHDLPFTHQHCPRCHTIKPLNHENFHKSKSRGCGFQTYCRPCRSGEARRAS